MAKTTSIRHIAEPAVIDKPMVLIPVEDYEELLEKAQIARSKILTKEIGEARKRFGKGKGRLLEEVIRDIETGR